MNEVPGHLEPIREKIKWLDMVYKSDLPHEHKLAATVISKTSFFRKDAGHLTNTSIYTISRILNFSVQETRDVVDELLDRGWLFDTGQASGARPWYLLTFNLLPKDIRK